MYGVREQATNQEEAMEQHDGISERGEAERRKDERRKRHEKDERKELKREEKKEEIIRKGEGKRKKCEKEGQKKNYEKNSDVKRAKISYLSKSRYLIKIIYQKLKLLIQENENLKINFCHRKYF